MKAKIISHEIKEVDGSTILYMIYSYKGFKSPVSIIDIPDCTPKAIKQYIKTAEKAINIEIKAKEDGENKLKKELKQNKLSWMQWEHSWTLELLIEFLL